eukprot:286757-Chlamydomonas_euryale.AAC.1
MGFVTGCVSHAAPLWIWCPRARRQGAPVALLHADPSACRPGRPGTSPSMALTDRQAHLDSSLPRRRPPPCPAGRRSESGPYRCCAPALAGRSTTHRPDAAPSPTVVRAAIPPPLPP